MVAVTAVAAVVVAVAAAEEEAGAVAGAAVGEAAGAAVGAVVDVARLLLLDLFVSHSIGAGGPLFRRKSTGAARRPSG